MKRLIIVLIALGSFGGACAMQGNDKLSLFPTGGASTVEQHIQFGNAALAQSMAFQLAAKKIQNGQDPHSIDMVKLTQACHSKVLKNGTIQAEIRKEAEALFGPGALSQNKK